MVLIKVVTVGAEYPDREDLRAELEDCCRDMYDKGWELKSTVSRGGTIYCVFTKSFH